MTQEERDKKKFIYNQKAEELLFNIKESANKLKSLDISYIPRIIVNNVDIEVIKCFADLVIKDFKGFSGNKFLSPTDESPYYEFNYEGNGFYMEVKSRKLTKKVTFE